MTPLDSKTRFPVLCGFGALLSVRALVGVFLVFGVAAISVDDYFRVFHALWWWQNPSFTSSHDWLPGYTYVFGPVVGLSGDTLLAPRLGSLALQLIGGGALAAHRGLPPAMRWLAAIWVLCSPLSLVLGSVPLSESLFTALILVGAVALDRFVERGKSPLLLLAAVGYLGAAMVRYEAWVLLPVFSAYALSRPPEKHYALVNRTLAFLPWFFPLIWTALLWALLGEPFTYLRILQEDHFGPGDLIGELLTPVGLVTVVQLALAVAVVGLGVAALARARRGLGQLLWESHALAAAAFVALVTIRGDVPSQFPLRIFHPVLLFAAVPLARLLAGRLSAMRRALLVGSGVGAALLGLGAACALSLSSGFAREDLQAARYLGELLDGDDLAPDAHALIDHQLPEAAALLVYSNCPERVHIDAVGGPCPPRLLGTVELVCPVEGWSADVGLAVVAGPNSARSLEIRGWRRDRAFGRWTFYLKPPGAVPLGRSAPAP